MRVLLISDIHANLEALEAVLADASSWDVAICLGDVVGYGPNPVECIDRVRRLPGIVSLTGNHDLATLGELDLVDFNPVARQAVEWTRDQLDAEARDWLSKQPPQRAADNFRLVHASPRDPVWEYMEETHQGPPNFALFDEPLCFVGHTHVPRIFTAPRQGEGRSDVQVGRHGELVPVSDGRRRIINPGGVGQPRDGDPRAAYALWDQGAGQVELIRVEYPIALTQDKIRAAGLPNQLAARLALGM